MADKKYLMALDQGTTSSRCIIFSENNQIISQVQLDLKQYYPNPGWVEHDPNEILYSMTAAINQAMEKADLVSYDIAAAGITNQRETVVVWDKHTGNPIYNAIVWQCRRTADMCEELKNNGYLPYFKEKTGLIIDAYFSLTKLIWILDNVPDARIKAERGDLLFGTIDTWLLWKFTGGKVHATDYTNASRTMMFNIHKLRWDDDILYEFNIPSSMLPEVKPSAYVYAKDTEFSIPIAGIAGDQQAALFGQTCVNVGDVKNTYGTGCFLLMNTGDKPILSNNGLLTTLACGIDSKPVYALEGSVFIGGAVIQWLRDEMMMIYTAAESETAATAVPDNNGVYIVPAFTGLGTPYWDSYARGIITGLTRGSNRNHIIRAALESIAYQTYDVLKTIEIESSIKLNRLRVDGGACVNNFLMQFQSDINNVIIERPTCIESTALGAQYLAGLAIGYYNDFNDIISDRQIDAMFVPFMNDELRDKYLSGWHNAVKKALLN